MVAPVRSGSASWTARLAIPAATSPTRKMRPRNADHHRNPLANQSPSGTSSRCSGGTMYIARSSVRPHRPDPTRSAKYTRAKAVFAFRNMVPRKTAPARNGRRYRAKFAASRHFWAGSDTRNIALNGTCWAAKFATIVSGPKATSAAPAPLRQCRSNQPVAMHMPALVSPKPSMARLTTSEPKCAQLPTEKIRITPICNAITAPATRPTQT